MNLTLEQLKYLSSLIRKEIEFFDDVMSSESIHTEDYELFSKKQKLAIEIQKKLKPKKMGYVAVPFGTDGTTGDSTWIPEYNVPYKEGMTAEQLKVAFAHKLYKENGHADELLDVDDFLEEELLDDLSGWWIISKEYYKLIMNTSFDCGNDSAIYAAINALKMQIEENAVNTIKLIHQPQFEKYKPIS